MIPRILTFFLLLTAFSTEVRAQQNLQIIRDSEIESVLSALYAPLLKSARLSESSLTIYLVNNKQVNAFVSGGANVFIYTGLIRKTENVNELMGVLAHELVHLAQGHLLRLKGKVEQISLQSLLLSFLTIGAAVLSDTPEVAIGGLLSSQQLSQGQLLAYSRVQESVADQGAVKYLEYAKLSSYGLYTFLEKLSEVEALTLPEDFPLYLRTHPPTERRLQALEAHLKRSPWTDQSDPPEYQEMYQRMKAKLTGFLYPEEALSLYDGDSSISGRYGYAIALYRQGEIEESLSLFSDLIAQEPENPFFYEMKGQILLENGRIEEALLAYEKAVDVSARADGLLHMKVALLLLQRAESEALDQVVEHLRFARTDKRVPEASLWRLFSIAYGRKGDTGLLYYVQAEEALSLGDKRRALSLASKAQDLLPRGSKEWIRAQDILSTTR